MTLRELLSSVNAEDYADSQMYQILLKVKPEYGTNRRIVVKHNNGKLVVSNVHVGSLGDIVTYTVVVDSDLQVSKTQLMDAILNELSSHGYDEGEQADFWNEMTNLQKAKIIR